MAKRASENDAVDPVRARLAGAVAGAVVEREPATVESPSESTKPDHRPQPRLTREPQGPRVAPKLSPTQATVNRKFMVTEQEAERMQEVTMSVSKAFGGKVPHTKITRALWSILAEQEERIKRVRPEQSRRAPSTGDSEAQAEYEIALYEFLSEFFTRNR